MIGSNGNKDFYVGQVWEHGQDGGVGGVPCFLDGVLVLEFLSLCPGGVIGWVCGRGVDDCLA